MAQDTEQTDNNEQQEQEQGQDTTVQAPESVPTTTSSESASTPAPKKINVVEDVTGTLTDLANNLKERGSTPPVAPLLVRDKAPRIRIKERVTPLLPEDLDSLTEAYSYASKVLQGGDRDPEQVKRKVAAIGTKRTRDEVAIADLGQRKESYTQVLDQLLASNEVSASEVADGIRKLQEMKVNRTALEENAVTGVMSEAAAKDPEWLAIYEVSATLTEQLQKNYEGALLLGNYLAEKQAKAEKDFDFGLDFIRGLTSLDLVSKAFGFGPNFAEGMKEFGREFNVADTTEDKLAVLERFDKEIEDTVVLSGIFGQNPDFDFELANTAFNATEKEREQALALGGIEGVLTLIGAGATVKSLKGLGKGTFSKVKSDLGAEEGYVVLREAQQDPYKAGGIPTLTEPGTVVSSNARVKEILQRQDSVLRDAAENNIAPVMRTEMEQLPVFDKGTVINQSNTADGKMVSDFGTKKGNPFATKSAATQGGNRLGIGDFEVVEVNAGYVVRKVHNTDAWGAPAEMPKSVNWIGRNFDNVDNWVDGVLHAKGRQAEAAFSSVERTFRDVWKSGMKGLGSKQKRDLSRTLTKLRELNTEEAGFNRWWSEGEFAEEYKAITGNAPTDKELLAYGTYRQLNDFAYRMDNMALVTQAENAGYTGLRIKDWVDGQLTGKVRGNVQDDTSVYVQRSGGESRYGDLNRDDYSVIELDLRDKADLIEAGVLPPMKTRLIAVPKNSITEEALDPVRIPYKAGGRVQHDRDTVWLKQANVRNADGAKLRLRDRTMYRADSLAEAEDYAKRWNKAKDIAKQFQDTAITAQARASFRELDLGELDDFIQNANAYGWDLDQPMQALRHREMVTLSDESGVISEVDDLDYIVEGVGNRFSKRGQGVPHILGDAGSTALDPLASLSQSIDLTARNVAFSSYRQFALERFKDKFGQYLDIEPTVPLTAYLRAAPNNKARKANLIQSIEGHQNYVRDVIGNKFEDERVWDRYVNNAAKWAVGRDFGPVTGGTIARGVESLTKIQPFAQLRNLTFNAKLGMFNPASFIMQAAQAPVIAATVQRYGIRSLSMYPVFRMALYGADDLNTGLWKELNKRVGSLGDDAKFLGDFEEAVKEFRRLGMDNFGGRMAYIDAATGSNVVGLARGSAANAASSVAERGRFFFNEGEMIPRAVSYMAARARWLSDKKVNPKGLPATSSAGRQFIVNQTDKYILGMSRADIQQGLRGGFTGFATQFYSFILRATAAFTGRQFTRNEKLRMGIAYTALFGGAGVPFMDWAMDKAFGEADPTVRHKIKQGAVDGMLTEILGYETNFSDRAGIGKAWGDICQALTERDTFMETVAGAPGQTGHRAMDGLLGVTRLFSAVSNPDVTDMSFEAIKEVSKQVSSVNNTYKAIQAWNTGILLDRTGLPYMDVSRNELIGAIVGVPTIKYEELNSIYTNERKRADAIKEGVRVILRLQELAADTTNPEETEKYRQAISFHMNGLHNVGIGDDVTRRVFQSLSGETMYQRKFLQHVQRQVAEGDEFTDSSSIEYRVQQQQREQQ